MANIPWYRKYEELRNQVLEAKEQFFCKCEKLGANPNKVFEEVRREIIARIVHESNWQEGLYLDQGRTQELTNAVFDAFSGIEGPHIDMDWIINGHKKEVLKLKRKELSIEEIASYNLSSAHIFLGLIADELDQRTLALTIKCLNVIKDSNPKLKKIINARLKEETGSGFEFVDEVLSSNEKPITPHKPKIQTQGELIKKLSHLRSGRLKFPMRIDYIHFLHRITMMGILSTKKIGVFRKVPVHVGDPDTFFPVPNTIPGLMKEFCKLCNRFNIKPFLDGVMPTLENYDPIMKAAEVSYKFVRIHPYSDGNGRVSRLLMNLILWGNFPPVYLKADKKGRHRYAQALRRANRGNIEPLACLVAISLKEIYKKLLDAINVV